MRKTGEARKGASRWTGPVIALLYKLMSSKITGGRSRFCGGVLFISPRLCIKSSARTRMAEADAMNFVRQNTSIPVPVVHLVCAYKDRVYIVMERIKGTRASSGWYQRSEESKQNVLRQLKAMISELHSTPRPHGDGVSDINGGPIWDCRLPTKDLWGPFPTIRGFHDALLSGQDFSDIADDDKHAELRELSLFYKQPWSQTVFTHGDLSSLNILCRGDEVVGIIDWETAGWLPPYWEYVTAWNVNPQNQFWQKEVDKFLEPHPTALKMDAIRRKYFGDF
jgi:aminoglycoside phosphotransferase (APT) family kinase protein